MNATTERTWLEMKSAQLGERTLTASEEAKLARAWQTRKDRGALEQLVTTHLSLVTHTARRLKGYGVPLEELMAEGNLGLLRAVDRFEDRNVRFRTYAAVWVRAYMLAYVMRQKSIVTAATGAVGAKLFFKLRSARGKLEARLGPDTEAIDALLAKQFGLTVEQIRAHSARLGAGGDVSLGETDGEDSDTPRVEELLAAGNEDPEDTAAEPPTRRAPCAASSASCGPTSTSASARGARASTDCRRGRDDAGRAGGRSFRSHANACDRSRARLKDRLKKALLAEPRVLH